MGSVVAPPATTPFAAAAKGAIAAPAESAGGGGGGEAAAASPDDAAPASASSSNASSPTSASGGGGASVFSSLSAYLAEPTISVFIDCTKSNQQTGERSFGGRSLHDISSGAPNPYEQVMESLLGALSVCQCRLYGFGDSTTGAKDTFPFSKSGDPLPPPSQRSTVELYRGRIGTVALAGGTCFAPAIKRTLAVYEKATSRKGVHFCLIITDGPANSFKETHAALVEASKAPISVIIVGVGDGPWEDMHAFNASVHEPTSGGYGVRKFNNCNFVCLEDLRAAASGSGGVANLQQAALRDIPRQLEDMLKKKLLKAAK